MRRLLFLSSNHLQCLSLTSVVSPFKGLDFLLLLASWHFNTVDSILVGTLSNIHQRTFLFKALMLLVCWMLKKELFYPGNSKWIKFSLFNCHCLKQSFSSVHNIKYRFRRHIILFSHIPVSKLQWGSAHQVNFH